MMNISRQPYFSISSAALYAPIAGPVSLPRRTDRSRVRAAFHEYGAVSIEGFRE